MRPLLHVGYHKTGTTWLQQQVFSREAFALVGGARRLNPTFVEVNPFAFDARYAAGTLGPEVHAAAQGGRVPVLSLERLSGNPHSGGYDGKLLADRLAAVFPGGKVLIVIREQRSMILSSYKQYVDRGGLAPLGRYVDAPRGASRRVPLFRFDFFEYHHLIGYYQQMFGAANVLVLPYELLKADADAFLDRLGAFVGIPAPRANSRPANVSLSALALSFKRHANRWLVRDALNPAPPLPWNGANDALMRMLKSFDPRVPDGLREASEARWRHVVALAVAGKVEQRYAESNSVTEHLTGLDLRRLGYLLPVAERSS